MENRQVVSTLDRLEKALERAENSWNGKRAADAESAARAEVERAAQAEKLAALESRHAALKQALAEGLGQLDEIIAGINQ